MTAPERTPETAPAPQPPPQPPLIRLPEPEAIPEELRALRRWLCWAYEWRSDRWTKVPKQINGRNASSTDPATWTALAAALACARRNKWGVGIALGEVEPGRWLAGVDLDHAYVDGCIQPEAARIIEELHSYAERSPSGEGVHVLCWSAQPPRSLAKTGYEVYADGRYFTVTGARLNDFPVEDRTDRLLELRARLAGENAVPKLPAADSPVEPAAPPPAPQPAQAPQPEAADDVVERAADILAAHFAPEGSRNRAFLALAGACARGGLPEETALRLAEGVYRRLWPAHPDLRAARAEVEATYRKHSAGEEVIGAPTIKTLMRPEAVDEALRLLGVRPRLEVIPRREEPDLLSQRPTDAGNAERLFALHGDDYRYVGRWDSFVIWDGARWVEDHRNRMLDFVRSTARAVYRQAERLEGEQRAHYAKISARLESSGGAEGALKFAGAIQESVVLPDEFDQHPYLFNCLNGTIDLRTGELRQHRRENLLMKVAPVEYDPQADCPRFKQFLAEVFEPHPDVIPWLQKALGYSLTGSVREQCFFICWGTGGNGKGTLHNTLAELIGDYGQAMDIRSLAEAQARPDSPSEYIARLHGVRFAKAEEPSERFVLNTALIQWLTGDDILSARRLYQNSFQFQPTHKIWILTNPKPVIRSTDPSIWRRVKFIPFTVCFEGREDKTLRDKLRAERPGILRWLVEGAVRWYAEGLGQCETVEAATQAYREESDVVARFLSECCAIEDNAESLARPLYQAYRRWAEDGGERPLSDKRFSARLAEKGYERRHSRRGTVYAGVRLLEELSNE